MNKELKISAENVLTAYNNADANNKTLLEHLFGKELFAPKDIKERVKIFEDAVDILGNEHPLVVQYKMIESSFMEDENNRQLFAYARLAVIAAALNEGWEPQFAEDEYRYYPWFYFYKQKEIDEMSEEDKSRVVYRSLNNAYASGGVACANTSYDSSFTNTSIGSRLAFKTRELAEYAAKQFIEIWAEYVF